MSTLPPDSHAAAPRFGRSGGAGPASRAEPGAADLASRWAGLHEAAAVIAALAGEGALAPTDGAAGFLEGLAREGGWRLRLAGEGIEDLAAILQTGICALLAIHGQGGGAVVAPARALWAEFLSARSGILALCPAELAGRRRLA